MRRIFLAFAAVLLTSGSVPAAEVQVQVKATATPSSSASPKAQSPSATPAAALPQYRPALLGTGPTSVINRMDTAALIRDGQKDASLYFCSAVDKTGEVLDTWTYKQSPDSKLLERELVRCLDRARLIPAVYNHEPVFVLFYGTVSFKVVEGKPRLRIFANQEAEEIAKETDFVGPQPFYGQGSKFEGLHYPADSFTTTLSGLVELAMQVDATGKLIDLQVLSEYPPLVGFRRAAAEDFRVASFIPAFRDGKPVECHITLPVYYEPPSSEGEGEGE
jgi:hypothetical protein